MWEAAWAAWYLILSGYLFIGIVVALLAASLTSKRDRARGKPWATAAAAWYLGAPIVVLAMGWLSQLNNMSVAHQYQSLCKENSIDSISRVSSNIGAIKLENGAPDDKAAPNMFAAFGGVHRLFGFGNNPGLYRNAEGTGFSGAFVILKVRVTHHIPYVGTFYATGIDLEILDPQTQLPIARRRTFTNGIADQAASGDCTDDNFTKRILILYCGRSKVTVMRIKSRSCTLRPTSCRTDARASVSLFQSPCRAPVSVDVEAVEKVPKIILNHVAENAGS